MAVDLDRLGHLEVNIVPAIESSRDREESRGKAVEALAFRRILRIRIQLLYSFFARSVLEGWLALRATVHSPNLAFLSGIVVQALTAYHAPQRKPLAVRGCYLCHLEG